MLDDIRRGFATLPRPRLGLPRRPAGVASGPQAWGAGGAALLAVLALVLALSTGTALAAFGSSGTGSGGAAGATLAAPTNLAAAAATCPSGGTTGQRTVSWTASSDATGYLVEAARDAAFSDVVSSQTTTSTSATVTYPATTSSYTVYLRVRGTRSTWTGSSGATLSTASTCTSFTPSAPTGLTAGANTCTGTSGDYSGAQPLSWTATSGATGYIADAASDAAFSTILDTETTTATSTSFSIDLPASGKQTVYLRVRATAGSNTSAASATTTVAVSCPVGGTTTTTTTTTAATLTAPTNVAAGKPVCTSAGGGQYNVSQPLTWTAVSGATGYVADAALDSTFLLIYQTQTVTTASATYTGTVSANSTYTIYVRVKATAGTRSSGYSTTLKVTGSCP